MRGTTDADQRPDRARSQGPCLPPRSGIDHMTTARVDRIDRSVEKAHVWINDTAEELGTEDSHQAYRVLHAFLHAVRRPPFRR
jgi:hypothetical protein